MCAFAFVGMCDDNPGSGAASLFSGGYELGAGVLFCSEKLVMLINSAFFRTLLWFSLSVCCDFRVQGQMMFEMDYQAQNAPKAQAIYDR